MHKLSLLICCLGMAYSTRAIADPCCYVRNALDVQIEVENVNGESKGFLFSQSGQEIDLQISDFPITVTYSVVVKNQSQAETKEVTDPGCYTLSRASPKDEFNAVNWCPQ